MTNKAKIKADYIAKLQSSYDVYVEGSTILELANLVADKALSGKIKLGGECWLEVLEDNGLSKKTTMKQLSELP